MWRDLPIDSVNRGDVPDRLASTPLVTLAWRALQAEHRRRALESQQRDQDERRRAESWADIAIEIWKLWRSVASGVEADSGPGVVRQQQASADRILASLRNLGIELLAPEGEPYSAQLMDLFENLAQRVDDHALEPTVAEVVSPAVFCGKSLLRMGKAVVAVPRALG
jgi:hypothetical protein